ncbi:MAG: ester cyclase [Bacteroidota bacterium]
MNSSEDHNRHLIGRWYLEMWNDWDKGVIPAIVDEQISFRGSLGREQRGHEGLREYMDYIRAAFPDFHNEIELVITEGHQSFAKLKYSGTHTGEILGVAPTHRKIAYWGSAIFTFLDGKIMDVWVLGDIYGLLKQLQ